MKLDPEWIRTLAGATRFRPAALEKVLRLGSLAADVSRHPYLSKVLALKGGAALNLCFGPPRRLSVDLDFNYIAALDRSRMLKDRPQVEQALEELGRRQGYKVQRSAEEHAGRKIFFSYRSTTGSRDRVEVDLNYLFRLPVNGLSQLSMWQPGNADSPRVTVVGIEELCAGKFCALLSRALPRDLFDVALLPEIAKDVWCTERLRKILIAISAVLHHPLTSYGQERLDRVTDKTIEQQLEPMLTGAAPGAAELKARVWSDRLRRHPALRWKVRNARHRRTR
jgi:predicted nucleotidyltransferase component of viral defense system